MRLATRVGIAAITAIGLAAGQLSAAHAVRPHTSDALWPTACETRKSGSGGEAYCAGGAGSYQVIVKCSNGKTVYGTWQNPGTGSWAFCSSSYPTWVSKNLRPD